jgi:N-acetylmuramoyl-L-alanine amidase
MSSVISSGHSKHVRGASGVLDEVNEARRVVEEVADILETRGVPVLVFHDDTSTTQSQNLNTIVAFHNKESRDLDVSVHFNAFEKTDKPMGTEVLYLTQDTLAAEMSAAIAEAGDFIDRGAKKRTDLAFLNNTEMPAILIEVCFVDSTADAANYNKHFSAICTAIADVIE